MPPEGGWLAPDVDVVAICGPKSSPTIAQVLEADALLRFEQEDDADWFIADRATGETWRSGMDQAPNRAADVAYVGRTPHDGGYLLVIAGVHAIGSLGAVTWLREHLAELHSTTEGKAFGMVIGSTYDGLTIVRGPYDPTWDKSAGLGIVGGCRPACLLGGVSGSAH